MGPENNQLTVPDQVTVDTPPLHLPIEDTVILAVLNDAEVRGKTVRQKFRIDERAHLNTEFWKGNHVSESQFDARYQMAHVDNVVRQNLENKIKLATGHMPDIFAAPPDDQSFNMEASRDVQSWLRDRLDSGTIKRLLKNGLRKMDLDLLAIIKPRWKYMERDFCFELIPSKDILFGEGAKIYEDGYTIDGTDVMFHYVETSTQEVLNTFKDKADELYNHLASQTRQVPARIRYTEAHFRWYDKTGKVNEGIVWRYGAIILGKMRQPYFDYDNPRLNYFDRPRKPFILVSYANLGDTVYETTSDFEQGVPLNRIVNKRRRQITEIADRAIPKMVFSGLAMNKEQARNINPSPHEAVVLNDTAVDVTKAFAIIPATPPNPILYNDLLDLRGRLNSMFSVQGATNVEAANAGESGVSKQITREGDLVTSDDITVITVERVVGEMAGWAYQFARLFFDDDRPPARITDKEGNTQTIELGRDKIETDLQLVVKASTNDKQVRRADAIQMLGAEAIDPYSFYEDIDTNNPKERLRRLMAFNESKQNGDFSRYMEVVDIDMQSAFSTEKDAQRDLGILASGQQVALKLPGEKYVSTFMAFKNSPEYANMDQFGRMMIDNHLSRLRMMVDEEVAKRESQAGLESGQMGMLESGSEPNPMGSAFAAQPPANPLTAALQQRPGAPQPSGPAPQMQPQPAY